MKNRTGRGWLGRKFDRAFIISPVLCREPKCLPDAPVNCLITLKRCSGMRYGFQKIILGGASCA